jgi:hypothetical protein
MRQSQWARFGRSALQTLNYCCSQRTSCAPRGGCSRRISKGPAPMGPFGSNTVCRSAGPTELLLVVQRRINNFNARCLAQI